MTKKSLNSASQFTLRLFFLHSILYPSISHHIIQSLFRPFDLGHHNTLSCALSRGSGQWTNNRRGGPSQARERNHSLVLQPATHHSTLLSSSSWLKALLSDKFLQSLPDNNGLCNTSKRQECKGMAPSPSKSVIVLLVLITPHDQLGRQDRQNKICRKRYWSDKEG